MTVKDIIREIIKDEELELEQKTDLINRFSNANYSNPGYYLKQKRNSDEVELWIRIRNKNGEMERVQMENDNPNYIIEEYKKEITKGKIR